MLPARRAQTLPADRRAPGHRRDVPAGQRPRGRPAALVGRGLSPKAS